MSAPDPTWRERLRPWRNSARYFRHRLWPRASYAADREDVAAELLLGGVTRFIDVGANDGWTLSNSARWAFRGARGLCFEPNDRDFRRLAELYRWAPGVECVPQGLSDVAGTKELRSDGLLSAVAETADPGLEKLLADFTQSDAPLLRITVERLAAWLERRPEFRASDVVSIDVEGHELHVLHGIDWARQPKPARCLIIETHAEGANGSWRHRDFAAIDTLLAGHGYAKVAASLNNTFWLHGDEVAAARVAEARRRLPGYVWFAAAPAG